jgi:hypothetical protein
VAACLSSAAHAGTLCLASVGAYISQCSGCAPVTCQKTDERDVVSGGGFRDVFRRLRIGSKIS